MRDEQDKKTMEDSSGKKSPAPTEAEGQAPSKVRPALTGVENRADDAESASSLFKDAIAAFEEAQEGQEPPREGARGRSRTRKEPEPDEVEVVVDGEAEGVEKAKEARETREAKEAKKAKETVEPSPPAREPEPEKPAPTPSDEAKAGKKSPLKAPDSPKEKPGPVADDSLPAADALAMIERRKLRKTLRREGEPESPAGAYEPKEVEYHGALMKFTCRCGKRVSVAIDAAQTVGRCPKCGSRLVVPVAGRAKPGEQTPDKPKEPKKSKKKLRGSKSRHRAAHDVANRMRKGRTGAKKAALPVKVEVVAEAEPQADDGDGRAWGTRVSAFLIDQTILAVVFFVAVSLLEVAGLGGWRWGLAVALACVTWTANRLVILWFFHASVGMLVVGLRLTLAAGGTVPFGRTALRAATGAALLLVAPLALMDREGRTPADKVARTLIVPGERPF
ncbi:MAG: RDD family protein [Planctomycetota bacterium]|jgi:ribosomal protein S27E/uncharacterized RDD family membrane protein YckC